MKKIVNSTLKFFVFLIIFYPLILFFWATYAPRIFNQNIGFSGDSTGQMKSRLLEIENHSRVDILFIGSSQSYRGFDTRIFAEQKIKSFNIGSSSQSPIQSKLLLDRYISHLKPKTIVYAVNPTMFSVDGVESALDIITNSPTDGLSLEMTLKIKHIKIFNTFIYKAMCDFLNIEGRFIEIKSNKFDKYIPGGFVEKKAINLLPQLVTQELNTPKPYQIKAFEEIKLLAIAHEIKLILVYPPIKSDYYQKFSSDSFFIDSMKGTVDFYNFNGSPCLNDSIHFYDPFHLNQLGVRVFNEQFIEALDLGL